MVCVVRSAGAIVRGECYYWQTVTTMLYAVLCHRTRRELLWSVQWTTRIEGAVTEKNDIKDMAYAQRW